MGLRAEALTSKPKSAPAADPSASTIVSGMRWRLPMSSAPGAPSLDRVDVHVRVECYRTVLAPNSTESPRALTNGCGPVVAR